MTISKHNIELKNEVDFWVIHNFALHKQSKKLLWSNFLLAVYHYKKHVAEI